MSTIQATHRKIGPVGTFTVHAPADYRPRHREHVSLATHTHDPGDYSLRVAVATTYEMVGIGLPDGCWR